MSALHHVYQYRVLIGKCTAGLGLSVEEIDRLIRIEDAFAPGDEDERAHDGRRFARAGVSIDGVLRGGRLNDSVRITQVSPGGMVCRSAPYAEVGAAVELVIDDRASSLSYRFKARVKWRREEREGDDYVIGVELSGTPLLVHYRSLIAHDPELVRLAA